MAGSWGVQMLKLSDYRSKSKGLPDLLPYAALVEPGVILNKDGSLTAGWEVRGQDTASSTESDLSLVSSRFNNAVKLLGSGWMLHMDAIRSGHKAYPAPGKGFFPDPVTRLIDEERREFFSPGITTERCFSTSAVLTVIYKPNFQAARIAGKAQAGVSTAGALDKALAYFQTYELLQQHEQGRFSHLVDRIHDDLSATVMLMRHIDESVEISGFELRLIGENLARPLDLLYTVCSQLADFNLVQKTSVPA